MNRADRNQKTATTIDQSRRLLACGADPHTADMNWSEYIPDEPCLAFGGVTYQYDDDYNPILDDNGCHIYYGIPAWSLSALLTSVMPNAISVSASGGDTFTYQLSLRLTRKGVWRAIYLVAHEAQDPIEACVKAIEWLHTKGYKLNEVNFTKINDHEG